MSSVSMLKTLSQSEMKSLENETFRGHSFETEIHIQIQIQVSTILTLETKYLLIIYAKKPYFSNKNVL